MDDISPSSSTGPRLALSENPFLWGHRWCMLPGEVIESADLEQTLEWQEKIAPSWFGDAKLTIRWRPNFKVPARVAEVMSSLAAQSFCQFRLEVLIDDESRSRTFPEFGAFVGKTEPISLNQLAEELGLASRFNSISPDQSEKGDQVTDWTLVLCPNDLLHPMALFVLMKKAHQTSVGGYSFFETLTDEETGGPHAVHMRREVSSYSVLGASGVSGSYFLSRDAIKKLASEDDFDSWTLSLASFREKFSMERVPLALTEVCYPRHELVLGECKDEELVRGKVMDLAAARGLSIKNWKWDLNRGSGCPFPTPSTAEVAVIIPFRDQEELTAATFRSLAAQSLAGRMRLVAVDNGSAEEVSKRLYSLAKSLFGPDRLKWLSIDAPFNFAALNNRGVEACDEPHLLFLNNDVEFRGVNDLAHLQGFLEWPEVGMVGGALYYPDGQLQAAGIRFGSAGPQVMREPDLGALTFREVDALTFACAFARRSAFEEVGGLDEMRCPNGFGDALLGHRMRETGWRILCDPAISIRHHESKSRGSRPEEIERMEMAHEGIPLFLYGTEFLREDQEMIRRFGRSQPTIGKRIYRAFKAFSKELKK